MNAQAVTLFSIDFPTPKRTWRLPLLYALIAFMLCVLTINSMGWRHDYEKTWDLYLGFPAAILRGEGYRECPTDGYVWCDFQADRLAYRLPGYPLFLTAILAVVGLDDPLPRIRLIQAVLAGALVFLVAQYTQRLYGRMAALVAALFVIFGSSLIWFSSILLAEMFFALLVMALLYAWTFYSHRPFWLGVLLALAMLTKGTLVFAAPMLVLLLPRRAWLPLALGFGLLVGAWALRNYLVLGSFIPFSTGSGTVLLGANNPVAWASASGQWLDDVQYSGYQQFAGLPEVAWDRAQQRAAIDFVLSQPVMSWAATALAKLRLLFETGANAYILPVVLAGFWGLLALARRRVTVFDCPACQRSVRVIGVFWFGLLINTIIFWGDFRFRFPLDPMAAIITGALFVGVLAALRNRKVRSSRRASAFMINRLSEERTNVTS